MINKTVPIKYILRCMKCKRRTESIYRPDECPKCKNTNPMFLSVIEIKQEVLL
jgi:hypothetical protein